MSDDALNAADACASQSDYERAVDLYTEVLSKTDSDVKALSGRANAYIKLKDDVRAMADVQQAIKLQPENSLLQVQLSQVYRLQGLFEEGAALMTEAMERAGEQDGLPLLLERAHCHRRDMAYQKALNDYHAVLAREPDNVDALQGRGATYWIGNVENCIADCRRALELDPTCAPASFTLGEALRISGRPAEALQHFTSCLEHRNKERMDESDIYACRGLCLQLCFRNEEAIADLEKAFVGKPDRQKQALWQFKANHFLGVAAFDAGLKEHYYTNIC